MKPSHESIAVRAYFLWERSGKIEGRDLANWLDAQYEAYYEQHKLPDEVRWPLFKK